MTNSNNNYTVEPVFDIEFVVVPEPGAPIERRSLPPARARGEWGDANALTADRARALLAGLLRQPVTKVHIIDQVGRCYLIEYEPVGKVDPDIVLCDWPSARPINRAMVRFQETRARAWRDLGEFWRVINCQIESLATLLKGAAIEGRERAFVLRWAYAVRDTGAVLPVPMRESDNGWYLG